MIREPVLPTKRKGLTRRQRALMHDQHGGICVVCLQLIPPGEPFIDEHVIPLGIGGSNDASNRGPAHIPCAKIKTALDRNIIAKADRMRANHLGIKKRSTRPMAGTKASGFKRKMSGMVVRR